MVYYRTMGEIPSKRHTTFKREDGSLYREQVMGTKGFSGIQSILYHHHFPTAVTEATFIKNTTPEYEAESALRHRHFRTAQYDKKG
ncbi:homogentisate 1,2-dioxygenase, partial [Staphylococcus sp. SIMBA_130]